MVGSFYFFLPIFFLIVFAEYFYSLYSKIPLYSRRQTLANFACGVLQLILVLIFAKYFLVFYSEIQSSVGLFHFDLSWKTWVLAIFLVDFVYYWNHRLHHQIPFFWGLHAVHHQSPEINFSNGLRPAVLSFFTTAPSYMVLALFGIPGSIFFIVQTGQTSLQIFAHTRMPLRFGFIEKIFVFPSDHRVHHGTQSQYLNKNYGAFFIFWDHIFGTYKAEGEVPEVGVIDQMQEYNPIKSLFHPFFGIVSAARKKNDFLSQMMVWIWPAETSDNVRPLGFKQVEMSGLEFIMSVLLMCSSLLWASWEIYFEKSSGVQALPGALCSFSLIVALSMNLDMKKGASLLSLILVSLTTAFASIHLPSGPLQILLISFGFVFMGLTGYSFFKATEKIRI